MEGYDPQNLALRQSISSSLPWGILWDSNIGTLIRVRQYGFPRRCSERRGRLTTMTPPVAPDGPSAGN